MKNHKRWTRRDVTRRIGMAASAAIVGPGFAAAATRTPSQTAGPFYPVTGSADRDHDMTLIEGRTDRAEGEVILVRGRVLGMDGQLVGDATVDIWQANHHGRYTHPEDTSPAALDANFHGWGITQTDADGAYGFKTIKPAAYRTGPSDDSPQRARHIHVKVSRQGYAELTTQMYFPGDPLIDGDFVMRETPTDLRHLLVAGESRDEATGLLLYSFDVVLAKA